VKNTSNVDNSAILFQLGAINPVINSHIVLEVNFCPSGNMAVGNKNEANYDKYVEYRSVSLMDGVDVENLFLTISSFVAQFYSFVYDRSL